MISELDNLPNPMDDTDDGYDDTKDCKVLGETPLDLNKVGQVVRRVQEDQQRHMQEAQGDCSGPENFGEVEEPDDGDVAEPDDFYGTGDDDDGD